jgi:Spy/CpxP family protein refolding chaperone
MNSHRRAGLLAAALVAFGGGALAQDAKPAASSGAPAPTAAAPAASAPAASTNSSSGGASGPAKAIQSAMTSSLDKFFSGVDATPDQKTQIQGIMMVAVGKIMQLKGQFGKPQEDIYALVAAPKLDRDGFEALRAREMSGVEQVSRILMDAFVDSLAVLTPEQRAKFAEKLKPKPKVHTPTQSPGAAATPGG